MRLSRLSCTTLRHFIGCKEMCVSMQFLCRRAFTVAVCRTPKVCRTRMRLRCGVRVPEGQRPARVSAVLGTWSCISHAVASASLARDRAETSSESHADCQRSRLGRCGEGGYTRRCLNVHQTAVLLQTMPWHPNPLTPIGSLAQCPFQTHQPFEPATST